MGLVSQAGVTLGLAILINAEFPDWGGKLYALIVSMITLHETIGPILFRAALTRAGEVGRMDLENAERRTPSRGSARLSAGGCAEGAGAAPDSS